MENRGRRGRRRSRSTRGGILHVNPSSFFKNKSLYIAGVLCLGFLMLQQNCKNFYAKQELMRITSNVEDIARHLNTIQSNYQLLEIKLSKYSGELPKLQEQMAALQAAGRAVQVQRLGWNPHIHAPLPYVDVKLNLNPIRKPQRPYENNTIIT